MQSGHRSHRRIKLSIFRKDLLNICWMAAIDIGGEFAIEEGYAMPENLFSLLN